MARIHMAGWRADDNAPEKDRRTRDGEYSNLPLPRARQASVRLPSGACGTVIAKELPATRVAGGTRLGGRATVEDKLPLCIQDADDHALPPAKMVGQSAQVLLLRAEAELSSGSRQDLTSASSVAG